MMREMIREKIREMSAMWANIAFACIYISTVDLREPLA
jgi:hypothetical protein